MAKRLIDADKFLQWVVKRFKCVPLVGSCDNDSESMSLVLAQAPTVDAVEVVRCKDCKHWDNPICEVHSEWPDQYSPGYTAYMEPDDFCSYGERKDGGQAPQKEDV